MKKYVLGFVFGPDLKSVALILKKRPKWQEGRFNGIGGKIEVGETREAAMSREYYEETGVKIHSDNWAPFGWMGGVDWSCQLFASYSNEVPYTTTDEEVMVFDVDSLPENKISNVAWLVPLARDILTNSSKMSVGVSYVATE